MGTNGQIAASASAEQFSFPTRSLPAGDVWLLSVKPPPEWIWRGCSGLSVAFFFPFGVFTAKAMRAVPRDDLRMGGSFKLVFYPVGMLGAAVIVLQIYNLIVLNVFWAFFALIVFQLLAGTFQFVRLIILAS